MDPYEHRRSRPLHRYRFGWSHYQEHRQGIKHGHRRRPRRESLDPQRTPADTFRHAKKVLRTGRPTELVRQALLGTLLAIGVAFLVFSVWGLITILEARSDLRGAQSEATALAQDRTQLFTRHGRADAARQITKMQHGATSAASLVDSSIPLEALGWIPFVGQQVHGVTSLVNDFDTASVQAGTLLGSLRQLIAGSHGTSISLPDLEFLDANVHNAVTALAPLNRGAGVLVGPIANARNSFDSEITKITSLLATGGQLLNYAQPFLGSDGPRTYFVAGENNAEMRDQGAVLSWAILTANNGTFSMTKSHSVGTLRIRHPAPIRLPPGTLAAFGQLEPTQVWQSVNATGDFPLSAEVMAAMYRQRTHHRVDGVIGLDPITLMHVLQGLKTGVDVSGIPQPVTSHNVIYVLMHGLYLLYPKGYEQNQRHDEVAAVASQAVHWMKGKHHHYDLAYLVDQLAKAAKGRHLLVWSRYPVLEHAVENFGASGSLDAHSTSTIHLAIESAVAAKLDWYVHTAAIYNVTVDAFGNAFMKITVGVANTAPPHCRPHYVCGPDHINSSIPGQYVGRLDLWLPRGSIPIGGGLPESGLVLARQTVRLDPGHHQTIVLESFLPHAVHDGTMSLQFIPQSSLTPQRFKVTFSAPNWTVSGPSSALWWATSTKTFDWSLTH
jgi:Protein of unknown function (DUF4012)